MVSSDGHPTRTPLHALRRTQLVTSTSSQTTRSSGDVRIARRMTASSPVLKLEFSNSTPRHPSKSMPSELIMRTSASTRIPLARTSSHWRTSIVQPGESLKVTPSRRTLRQRTSCTMRGRGAAGFAQKRP